MAFSFRRKTSHYVGFAPNGAVVAHGPVRLRLNLGHHVVQGVNSVLDVPEVFSVQLADLMVNMRVGVNSLHQELHFLRVVFPLGGRNALSLQ